MRRLVADERGAIKLVQESGFTTADQGHMALQDKISHDWKTGRTLFSEEAIHA